MTREIGAKLHAALFNVPIEWRLCEECESGLEEVQWLIERNEADGFPEQRERATLHPCFNWLDTDGPKENGWDLDSITEEDRAYRWKPIPAYSEDIAAAWLVVEKIESLGYYVEVGLCNAKYGSMKRAWCHVADYGEDGRFVGEAYEDTAPMAICLAALKAVEP